MQIHLMTPFALLKEAALTKYVRVLDIFNSSAVRQRGKKMLDYVTRGWSEVDEVESIISYQSVLSLPRSWPKMCLSTMRLFWAEMDSPLNVCGRNTLTSRLFVFLLVMWLSCYRGEAHPVRQKYEKKTWVVEGGEGKVVTIIGWCCGRSTSTHLINNGMLLKHYNCWRRLFEFVLSRNTVSRAVLRSHDFH